MFDIFKKDIKIGDRVKLYLTTGKEPEGTVVEIGSNFVLLKCIDKTSIRFFDKLIGGWDVISSTIESPLIQENIHNAKQEEILINQDFLIEKANLFKTSLNQNLLLEFIKPNANIIKKIGPTCIASNNNYPKILIIKNKIADEKLFSDIEVFQEGSIIPVVIILYEQKEDIRVSAVALPGTLEGFIDNFIQQLHKSNFERANLLLSVIRTEVKFNKHLGSIINELKKIHVTKIQEEPNKNLIFEKKVDDGKKAFKNVEIEINDLIRHSEFEFALTQIEIELKKNSIEDKYKSSLLLKKAQIYSSINNPDASERAYQELVIFNEKIKASSNNLSHLYTELSRLQALKADKQTQALESVKKALKFNPNNNFAINLLKQFEGKTINTEFDIISKINSDEHLLIEAEDDSMAISKMIDLDIKEHKYTHPEIIRNGSKPTAFIAKLILEEAKKTRETDLSERYPIYLEAAKAFSELNIGSYDLQDYLESAAYYSMLKGNSLYITFRNKVFNSELDILKLTRLRDSACSYYLESLNLLSNIDPNLLLSILANYLKLHIVIYHITNNSPIDFKLIFKGQFADVFSNCLRNKNKDIEIIAYNTILSCGASSIHAWNKLASLPKGTGRLYDEFQNESNRKRIFELINLQESNSIDISSTPSEFLKTTFQLRRRRALNFNEAISKLHSIDVEPHNIDSLIGQWKQFSIYESLYSYTDSEIKTAIDNLLSILLPYLNRSQSERTNILIQARNGVEKQIKFINDNTTYFGRTFFYGLLNKWKRDLDILLEEKINQSYPTLVVCIDPPYYIVTDGEITAPIIIKNEGEATTEGFSLEVTYESTEYDEMVVVPFESDIEISAGGKVQTSIVIPPELLIESNAIEIEVNICAMYQKKKLKPNKFEFTIEEEPKSVLTYEDIPWRDGPIPPEHLFKGRKKLIADLAQHYLSIEKDKPYILYGLTRSGKSSVLQYLRKNIEGDTFLSRDNEFTVITFNWDFSVAASFKKAADFWEYILYQQTAEAFETYAHKRNIDITDFKIKENVRAKDFKIILDYIASKKLYPIFFVDEFSFIKTLIDDNTVNTAFLHTLRQYSLSELASFIYAGTYDIEVLIKDPRYGITGQLVNAIQEQVNEIKDDAAEELIEVIKDKLSFTPEAINHIRFLSGNVPYFIQIICKYCGFYAAENKRRYIGYPELEKVVRILIGKEHASSKSLVKKLPENTFQNNQYSPADPKEVQVLITSLTHFNKDRINDPRGVSFAELQKLWADKNINGFRQKLADAIQLLMDKKIILQEEDEGIPVYKLSVDLFRRWWSNHNQDINLTLTKLTEF